MLIDNKIDQSKRMRNPNLITLRIDPNYTVTATTFENVKFNISKGFSLIA